MDIKKTFIGSKMNKSLDERLIPNGEYTDALNIRISSDEDGEAGSVENAKGNEAITSLEYDGSTLTGAKCIGVVTDDSKETIYWFVTSSTVDMIVSYNMNLSLLRYHVVSETVLNFNSSYPINGIDLIDDLLFWTDNFNQPRRINVVQNYPQPVSGVDQITEDDISVIVKPPMSAPEITLINNLSDENYVEDRFLSFSYRYKYANGEYSALSEFTSAAFEPSRFRLDYGSYSNVGMQNRYNAVEIKVNTGSKQVIGFEICFKISNNNVINVIKRYNKSDLGVSNNFDYTVRFDNKNIYTTLGAAEILRLYDNVPRIAKCQTVLGRRLFYGNYVDGYDIDTIINYDVELVSDDIDVATLETELSDGADYTIETSKTITDSTLDIDLSSVELTRDSFLYIDFNLEHSEFGGDASYDDGVNMVFNEFNYNFSFVLPDDYDSVADLVSSQEFIDSVKTSLAFNQSSDGYSLTDFFNRRVVSKNGWTPVGTGVFNDTGDFEISASNSVLSIQCPAIKFVSDSDPAIFAYEYLRNNAVTASLSNVSSSKSLHSNRSYEVAVVYMDDYKRASTALVSNKYSFFVPAKFSQDKNYARVTMHSEAPSWATNYRFVMKPSAGDYDTIYASIYYQDIRDGGWWIRLEGENQTKAKVGDTLYVKRDSNGVLDTAVKTTVIDFKTQEEDFISGNKLDTNPNEDLIELQGTYMKLMPSNFNINYNDAQFISYGQRSAKAEGFDFSTFLTTYAVFYLTGVFGAATYVASYLNSNEGGKPRLGYPMYYEDDEGNAVEYAIPAGSIVNFYINAFRFGRKRGGCRSRYWKFKKEFIATRDYDNMYDFIIGENIDFEQPTNNPEVESSDDAPRLEFITTRDSVYPTPQTAVHKLKYMDINGKPYLVLQSGDNRCGAKRSYVEMKVDVNLSGSQLIFETEPDEANDDIFYESSVSYPIIDRKHIGNIQNQTSSDPAIIDLDIFNCYSFGNGAESFKILDKIATSKLEMGSRVTAVAEQDYKEAHRYSDITYSGVYNEETNLNKLNEFNLGLANYRPLERLFGPINRLHGRQTDLLVLQEDKISYLLAGKNLLSDATGGGTLTSVPEVLGTQVSRIEEFGISDDADTFDAFGYDVFFTDSKRGAVINLRGGSSGSDQLNVISNMGMRSWFRDKFRETDKNFKVGAFDPYSNEYVLSFLDEGKPFEPEQVGCGSSISGSGNFSGLVLQTTTAIGAVTVTYEVEEPTDIQITYNGVVVVDTTITGIGSLTFDKTLQDVNEYSVNVTSNDSWQFTFGCVEPVELSLVTVVTADNLKTGLQSGNKFYWTNGDVVSAESLFTVDFIDDPMDYYTVENGFESEGYFPAEGSTVVIKSRIFDTTLDEMYYMITDVLYDDISDILSNATLITNVQQISEFGQGTFPYNNPSNDMYLYIIIKYAGSEIKSPPYAYPQTISVDQDTATSVVLTGFDPDGGPITYSVVTNPSHGVLTGTEPNLTYTPDSLYVGLDSFTFKVNNGTLDSNIATINLNVSVPQSDDIKEFTLSRAGQSTAVLGCELLADSTRYHNGALVLPGIGDTVFFDLNGSVPINGSSNWYKTGFGSVIQIDLNGEVIDIDIC